MKTKNIFLIILVIGLCHCVAHADGLANESTNKTIKSFGYSMMRGTNGHLFYVDPSEFWHGAWKENADGWRVQLSINMETNYWYPSKGSARHFVSTNLMLRAQWGSMVRNSGKGYYMAPNGKFAKFELVDSKGNIIPSNLNAETNLLIETFNWYRRSAPTMCLAPSQSPPKNLY